MLRLRAVVAYLFLVGACLSLAEDLPQSFQIADLGSRCGKGVNRAKTPGRDHKIAHLAITYLDGTVTDGFRVRDGNQQKLVRWSEIVSLEIGTAVPDGAAKYVQCSVQFSDETGKSLYCIDGIVAGQTKDGDYQRPLDQVTALIPQK